VICAVATHRNPAGTGALHPLLEEGRAKPGAAGIPGPVRTALFDTGHASKDDGRPAGHPGGQGPLPAVGLTAATGPPDPVGGIGRPGPGHDGPPRHVLVAYKPTA
jgi:hypothetical protein